jgi:hypothetical protein
MALVLALNAILYLSNDMKSFKGWVLWIAAVFIHVTTIFTVPVILSILFSNKIKQKKVLFGISFIIGIVASFTYQIFVYLILKFVPGYAMYISSNATYNIFGGTGGGRIALLYIFLLLVVYLFIISEESESFSNLIMPALTFGLVFGIVNCRNELVNRMLWYYLALFLPFIPAVTKNSKLTKVGILSILVIYSIISLLENQNGIVPYITYWNYV